MKRLVITALLVMSVVFQNATYAVGQTTMTLYPIADNYADSKYPERGHYGKQSVLYVGNSYDREQNLWGSERIFIRFNVNELPRQYVIEQATLQLWQFYAPKTNQTYETHRVLRDWNETTQNWNNQPSWALNKTSEATAPTTEGVVVQWDITKDVQAWYSGQAANYGTMIKAAKEENATDASSGFWSREYPVGPHEEWRPKLVLALKPRPEVAYTVAVNAAGLPAPLSAVIYVDGKAYASVSANRTEEIMFVRGTSHNITATKQVTGPAGVRYTCDASQAQVSASSFYVFTYLAEYEVSFQTDPADLFQTPATGWHRLGDKLAVKRTGPETVDTAPGARLVFDGWKLNSQRLTNEPDTIVVDGPIVLEGRYRVEYYLNVTSPTGATKGSGWYTKDSAAPFSVDMSTYPDPGPLGLLGVKRSFVRWIGSNNFLGAPEAAQGLVLMEEPTKVQAVWQEDWSSSVFNLSIVLALAACILLEVAWRRRGHRRSKSKLTTPRTDRRVRLEPRPIKESRKSA
jgi:hypothetical protein